MVGDLVQQEILAAGNAQLAAMGNAEALLDGPQRELGRKVQSSLRLDCLLNLMRRPVVLRWLTVACTNKKSANPLANVGIWKQPDKVLFDRAMDAMKHNRFDVAR